MHRESYQFTFYRNKDYARYRDKLLLDSKIKGMVGIRPDGSFEPKCPPSCFNIRALNRLGQKAAPIRITDTSCVPESARQKKPSLLLLVNRKQSLSQSSVLASQVIWLPAYAIRLALGSFRPREQSVHHYTECKSTVVGMQFGWTILWVLAAKALMDCSSAQVRCEF